MMIQVKNRDFDLRRIAFHFAVHSRCGHINGEKGIAFSQTALPGILFYFYRRQDAYAGI